MVVPTSNAQGRLKKTYPGRNREQFPFFARDRFSFMFWSFGNSAFRIPHPDFSQISVITGRIIGLRRVVLNR